MLCKKVISFVFLSWTHCIWPILVVSILHRLRDISLCLAYVTSCLPKQLHFVVAGLCPYEDRTIVADPLLIIHNPEPHCKLAAPVIQQQVSGDHGRRALGVGASPWTVPARGKQVVGKEALRGRRTTSRIDRQGECCARPAPLMATAAAVLVSRQHTFSCG